MDITEGLLIGLLGTGLGLLGGVLVLRWVTTELIGNTMPEIGLDVALSSGTIATALVLGVAAVALAPLLTLRRIRRMDIPSTLRVVE